MYKQEEDVKQKRATYIDTLEKDSKRLEELIGTFSTQAFWIYSRSATKPQPVDWNSDLSFFT